MAKKRLVLFLLALSILISVTGCGKGGKTPEYFLIARGQPGGQR